MTEHVVAGVDELPPGERVIVEVRGVEICVFNIDGEYHAVLNWCPHQGGPLCEGDLGGATRATFDKETLETEVTWVNDGRIIACPWHGWEFDVETGESLSQPDSAVPTHDVITRNNEIIIQL